MNDDAHTVKDSLMVAPCPCCGSPAVSSDVAWNNGAATMAMVLCLGDDCGANLTAKTEIRAVERWNRRAAS